MGPIFTAVAGALALCALQSPALADCTCRARGVLVSHGQTACIPTPQGAKLAQCVMVSNVASWKFLDGPCPLASIEDLTGSTSSAGQSPRIIR